MAFLPKPKTLRPMKKRPIYFDALERYLIDFLKREIYLPILKELELPESRLHNTKFDLLKAIMDGRIQYFDGHFEGRLSAKLSAEIKALGATWDRKRGQWKLPSNKLDDDIRVAIAASFSKHQAVMRRIDRRLKDILPDQIAERLETKGVLDSAIFRMNRDFESNIKRVTLAPKLTDAERDRITIEHTHTLKLAIKDWTQKQTEKMREDLQESILSGARHEAMVPAFRREVFATKVKRNFDQATNKAKFLAKQETSLLMTKFQEARYRSAGVNKYRWKTVHMPKDATPSHHTKGNVRYFHGLLDGKIFTWDTPPVVDQKGHKKHPGQDYNCRCEAIPIVEF